MGKPDPETIHARAREAEEVESKTLQFADLIVRIGGIHTGAFVLGALCGSALVLAIEWEGTEAGLRAAWEDAAAVALDRAVLALRSRQEAGGPGTEVGVPVSQPRTIM